jgi:hypothetical protein
MWWIEPDSRQAIGFSEVDAPGTRLEGIDSMRWR